MRVAMYYNNRDVRLEEMPTPQIGPGELLGTRQTGALEFRVARLERDRDLLEPMRAAARQMQARHPDKVEALIRRWLADRGRYANA